MVEPRKPAGSTAMPDLQKEVLEPSGWQAGWVWIVLVVLFVVGFWFAGWGWASYGGWWWGNRAARPVAAPPAVTGVDTLPEGSGVPVLDAANKMPFVGKPFAVSNVVIEQKSPNGAMFWIGARNSALGQNAAPMLVITAGSPTIVVSTGSNNTTGQELAQGEIVSVTGTVVKAPPKAQVQKEWPLSPQDAERLEKEGVYIQASQVTSYAPENNGASSTGS